MSTIWVLIAIHCKPHYVHGERIWLRETSEGDAEKGANNISCSETIAISMLSNISSCVLLAIAIDY